MGKIGMYLIFFSIGSAILSQTNYQFRLMSWMNDMGNGAWAVRAIMLAIGAALIFADTGQRQPQQHQQPNQQYR